MKLISGFLNLTDSLNEWVGRVFGLLTFILTFTITYDVFMRYFFKRPVIWATDINGALLLALVFMGGGYALLHGGHVKVDIIYSRFPPRMKAILDLVTYPSLFIICFVLVLYGGETAWEALIDDRRFVSYWGGIIWPALVLIPIGGILIGLQGLAKWIRDLLMVVKGTELKSKWTSGEGGSRG